MNAQQQALLNREDISTSAAKKASSAQSNTPRDNVSSEPPAAARERAKVWSTEEFGRLTAGRMMPSVDACFSMFNDWCNLARSAADQIEEDMKVIQQSWVELSKCQAPNELAKAGAELREKFTQQCAKSTQKLASLAGDYATRRWRASTELAATMATVGLPKDRSREAAQTT